MDQHIRTRLTPLEPWRPEFVNTPIPRWACTLIMTTLAGCAVEADHAVTWTERDSAGVTIVESAVDPDATHSGWFLADQASLTIGTLAGSPEFQFFRIAGAHRFADGRIAVVNGGSQEVRVYGGDRSESSSFPRRFGP